MSDKLSVTVTAGAINLKLSLSSDGYEALLKKIKGSKDEWISVDEIDGKETWIKRPDVVAIKSRAIQSDVALPGITIKEICKVTGWSYPTWVRKINSHPSYQLEMLSERRVAATEKNFDKLKLTKTQRTKLLRLEVDRLKK